MQKFQRLSAKIVILSMSLLAVALVSIGLTMWVTRQLDGGAAAVNEAGRLRMQTWRLVAAAQLDRPRVDLTVLTGDFDRTLELLRHGDPSRPLFVPWDDETHARFEQLLAVWETLRAESLAPSPPSVDEAAAHADLFVAQVDLLVSAIERRMQRLNAGLNLFQFGMMALAVAGAVLMLYVGRFFVVRPLGLLREALGRVQGGDFAARVEVDTRDEFAEVAAGFNHMAAALQALYGSLEAQVRAKTATLEAQSARLSALYEVSSFLAEAHTLEELAQGFAAKIQRLSRADGVAIRWSDESQRRYLMLASEGLPEDMVESERCVVAGSCACGRIDAAPGSRVIPILAQGAAHDGPQFIACARAGFATLVTVPIRLQQRVLGEVDLFYRDAQAPTAEERGLHEALASHLASAIENLRTEALLREAAASEERALLARELHDSIAQSLAFLKIQLGMLRTAVQRQDRQAIEQAVTELDDGVRESTADVRELLVHFRTRADSEDIEQALRVTLKKFEHQSAVQAHLEIRGHGVPLPSDVQLQVLHVVQEALSNVRKHARASEVWLTVDKEPHWRFEVRDNGVGFDGRERPEGEGHVGLRIMRERAARIGARVQVASAPGEGARVQLELPG